MPNVLWLIMFLILQLNRSVKVSETINMLVLILKYSMGATYCVFCDLAFLDFSI